MSSEIHAWVGSRKASISEGKYPVELGNVASNASPNLLSINGVVVARLCSPKASRAAIRVSADPAQAALMMSC